MNRCHINIKGMHCRSCELLVEDELLKIPGVDKAVVNHRTGVAEIRFKNVLYQDDVENAVGKAGYILGIEKKIYISRSLRDYQDLGLAFFIAISLYLIAKNLGIFNLSGSLSGNYSSLPIVFLVGLTAGVSTCMALVGGLVLGASARYSEAHPDSSGIQKFTPHIFFNLGRIISYFILGGVIGAIGAVFQLSSSALGLLTIAVAVVMLVLGGQLIDIFPFLKSFSFTIPKSLSRHLGLKTSLDTVYSHRNSFTLGALTFFMPCGFTQAMQLYSMSTGSPVVGAVTMGVFALGTTPGLLGVGGLASAVKGNFSKIFFKTAGVIVILLAFFNLSNGLNLLGLNPSLIIPAAAIPGAADPNVVLVNGVQEVRMTQTASGYSPNSFTIRKGIPVKWIITSQSVYTCAASIVSSDLGIRQSLQLGENVFNFTPSKTGTIRFSCSMGMYTGVFNVVDENGKPSGLLPDSPNSPAGTTASCGSSGGCGCGGGGVKKPVTAALGEVVTEKSVQVIKAVYTRDEDILPNQFTVKAGRPVRFEIAARDDGSGCMGSVTLPGLTSQIEVFSKGRSTVFEFIPTKPGNFGITCAMGIPRGQIQVI